MGCECAEDFGCGEGNKGCVMCAIRLSRSEKKFLDRIDIICRIVARLRQANKGCLEGQWKWGNF